METVRPSETCTNHYRTQRRHIVKAVRTSNLTNYCRLNVHKQNKWSNLHNFRMSVSAYRFSKGHGTGSFLRSWNGSTGDEIDLLFWNPKVHHRTHLKSETWHCPWTTWMQSASVLLSFILLLSQQIRHSGGLRAWRPCFDSQQGQEICLFSTAFRPALGPTQPHNQWVTGTLSPAVKRPGPEAGNSPPSSTEVKYGGAIPPLLRASS
jgi:hypothetical protein